MSNRQKVTILIYIRQVISNQNPNALFEEINKYQAEECKSWNSIIIYIDEIVNLEN